MPLLKLSSSSSLSQLYERGPCPSRTVWWGTRVGRSRVSRHSGKGKRSCPRMDGAAVLETKPSSRRRRKHISCCSLPYPAETTKQGTRSSLSCSEKQTGEALGSNGTTQLERHTVKQFHQRPGGARTVQSRVATEKEIPVVGTKVWLGIVFICALLFSSHEHRERPAITGTAHVRDVEKCWLRTLSSKKHPRGMRRDLPHFRGGNLNQSPCVCMHGCRQARVHL